MFGTGVGVVETLFKIMDGGAASALMNISGAGNTAEDALGSINSQIQSFNRLILGGVLTLATDQIIKLNKGLEDTKYQLAGSIGAAGFTKNFSDSMLLAKVSMQQIREEAAKLPGTDLDFLTAFSTAMPALKEAGMTDLTKMVTLSDNLVAVARSQGIDAAQAGRDIMQMARGSAGMDVRTFMTLKSAMGVKDQDEWRKKSGKQRIELLEKAVTAYKPLLNNFENTWEAISSTAESYAKNIMLNLTGPLFEAVKGPLRAMNDAFSDMQETILGIIQYVGKDLAGAFGWAIKVAGQLVGGGVVTPDMSNASGGEVAAYLLTGQGPRRKDQFGPDLPLPDYTSTVPKEHSDFRTGLGIQALGLLLTGFELLAPAVEATATFLHTVGTLLWDLLAPILPPIAYAFTIVLHVLGTLWEALMAVGTLLFAGLRPVLLLVMGALGFVAMALLNIISGIVTNFMEYVIKPMIRGVQMLTDTVNQFVQFIMDWLGKKGFQFDLSQGMKSIITDKMGEGLEAKVNAFLAKLREQADADKDKAAALNKGAKAKVVQNFNNNRFHIDQAFAEGFDPDRVLTAVRRDVGKLAARRLGSDITPLFSDGI